MRDIRDMEAFAQSQNAVEDIYAERRRQVDSEGWTTEHDDAHYNGELGAAAASWAHPQQVVMAWGEALDKSSKPRRRQLVIAGALIIAEIERLDRLASTGGGDGR